MWVRGPSGRGGRSGGCMVGGKRPEIASEWVEKDDERRVKAGGIWGQELRRRALARSIHKGRQGVTERRSLSSKVRDVMRGRPPPRH